MRSLRAAAALLSFALLPVPGSAAEKPAPVDYVQDIKPLLLEHCASCHGADEQQSGLRVDFSSVLFTGGDRGPAVIKGKSEESPLYQALLGKNDISRMPAESPPLSDAQIQLVKRWIDEGANAPAEKPADGPKRSDHWAFQPVRRPAAPQVAASAVVHNAIDRFIVARLEKEGLTPSAEADRTTLIRRLSLDLRGLPPSIEEVDAFVADTNPDAYERLVDRMLASPHYGERWGRYWLDAARYADSNGFTIDSPRSIWSYRDWVVDSINANLPFDRFSLEQLAGDMLGTKQTEQLVATGFHRNTLINEEGGTDKEQFRVESIVDRVNTTGTVFLGLTVACAQCHNHKYDPISQREYYDLFAIFNNCDEPEIQVPSNEQSAALAEIDRQIAETKKPLAEHDARFIAKLPEWSKQIAAESADPWKVLDPAAIRTERGALLTKLEDKSLIVDFSVPANDNYIIEFDAPFEEITAIRLETLTHPSLPMMGPGRGSNGNFVLSEFELEAGVDGGAKSRVKLAGAVADHSQDGYPVSYAIDGKAKTGWAINVNSGSLNVNREAVFFPAEPIRGKTPRLTVTLKQNHFDANFLVGRFRISAANAPVDMLKIPAGVRRIAQIEPEKRTPAQAEELAAAFRATDSERAALAGRLDSLKSEREQLVKTIPTTLVLQERKEARESHILLRGDFLRKGARVSGGVPAVLPAIRAEMKEAAPSRRDLANWLFDPANPLTSRVTVNRFWQAFFGTGLVETENDFGTQGSPPSHPELLDWLADEFFRSGWDVKSIHRQIVVSATYRQASELREEIAARDPANRLLARQSRLRLEAEAVRDVTLAAAGVFCDKMHGPGVYPPQPEGIYVLTQQKKSWPESQGPDRYRRGLYTHFWRSSPYPMLPTFDAPDANTACTRRPRSNTPLQALTLANDRSFFEMAVALAKRILNEGPKSNEERVRYAFRICLAREPKEAELNRLLQFLQSELTASPQPADEALAAVASSVAGGPAASTSPAAPQVDRDTETTAWVAFSRVLLNLDEFITRE
ncbi:MAG: PSD1 and planctomycete cytochrome C domain-containing protein [Planctomycetaceae bacterium]